MLTSIEGRFLNVVLFQNDNLISRKKFDTSSSNVVVALLFTSSAVYLRSVKAYHATWRTQMAVMLPFYQHKNHNNRSVALRKGALLCTPIVLVL